MLLQLVLTSLKLVLLVQVTKDQGVKVGVFTRDFRYDELTCRVLITVPACLEILLFSSTQSHRNWVKRLRYVIFDEVHCLLMIRYGTWLGVDVQPTISTRCLP